MMKEFLKNNCIFFVFVFFFLIVEIGSLQFMHDYFSFRIPWFSLTLVGIIGAFYFLIPKKAVKNYILHFIFVIILLFNLISVIIADTTGYFLDYSMFFLVRETGGALDMAKVDYFYIVFVCIVTLLYFVICFILSSKIVDKKYFNKLSLIISLSCLVFFSIAHCGYVIINNKITYNSFINRLYTDKYASYSSMGNTGNFINELYKSAFFKEYNEYDNNQIKDYLYEKTNKKSEYFGISKGNNVVTILAESFEWFAFINNEELYPNGNKLSDSVLDELFPNLRKFYKEGIVMDSHYVISKTDMSENEALLGSYPSDKNTNFNYTTNTYVSSLAKVLKQQYPDIYTSYFHNNGGIYYNRDVHIKNLGYDNIYFIEDMAQYGATIYQSGTLTDEKSLNLDSEMVRYMSDQMFPTDKQFHTQITTVSMHGNYVYRENMQPWLDKMESLNVNIENESLKNYMVSAMELDSMFGLMFDELEKRNLLDSTTIILFSDHNAYGQDLSNKVKETFNYDDDNFINLNRVPLMIYDNNISHQIINKFTTTYDITPTILDLLGINYYSNFYIGNSIFNEEETILYSRTHKLFLNGDIYFTSINNILYSGIDNLSEEYLEVVEEKCKAILHKIYYLNHVFEYDYFKDENNYNLYADKMMKLNP